MTDEKTALEQARRAYYAACDAAQADYDRTMFEARQAYDAAVRPAKEAFEELLFGKQAGWKS